MPGASRSHETAANRIAMRYHSEYNKGPGVDIKTDQIAVEVETLGSVSDGIRQLQGHRGPAYIGGANQATVQEAIDKTKGTTVGVMDNKGNILKPSSRKR